MTTPDQVRFLGDALGSGTGYSNRDNLTGQQMQDDARARAQGMQNVRGPDGKLQKVMSAFEVNERRARALAGSGANPLLLSRRDQTLQQAGSILRKMDQEYERALARQETLSDLKFRDDVETYNMERKRRGREQGDWGFEDEKRNFQRGLWDKTRSAMGGGSVGIGGNFGVSGLR